MVESIQELVEELKEDEGFEPMPYVDTTGHPTIGYGTKLPIDHVEAQLLLEKRLSDVMAELRERLGFFDELPAAAQSILLNMAYNLGVPRLMSFKRMIAALDERDFKKAAKEMRNSLWYRQVGRRAERLAQKMETLSSSK